MRWSEIDFKKQLWTLPRGRMKANQLHEVPLNALAIEILKVTPHFADSDFVFTTNGTAPVSGYSKPKRRIDALLPSGTPHWVLHDVRRSVASGLARIGVGLPVIEKILGHSSGSFRGVVGIYQRFDFADAKRQALDGWGKHVDLLISGKPASKVVRLPGKRRQ